MGYESSKIYRLQHDDGHFYIGSSINELRMRLRQHKVDGKKRKSRVYTHINGEWDKVKIVLIEAFECNNRDELHRKENEYIQKELKNELCLNHYRAFLTEEDRKEQGKKYYETNKEKIKEQVKAYGVKYYEQNTDKILKKHAEYREKNREETNRKAREKHAQIKDERNKRRRDLYAQNKAKQSNLTSNLTAKTD